MFTLPAGLDLRSLPLSLCVTTTTTYLVIIDPHIHSLKKPRHTLPGYVIKLSDLSKYGCPKTGTVESHSREQLHFTVLHYSLHLGYRVVL